MSQTHCFRCDWERWKFCPGFWVKHCPGCESSIVIDENLREKFKGWTQKEAILQFVKEAHEGKFHTSEVVEFLLVAGLNFKVKAARIRVSIVLDLLMTRGVVERIGRGRYMRKAA